jgi:hypothetical protein
MQSGRWVKDAEKKPILHVQEHSCGFYVEDRQSMI